MATDSNPLTDAFVEHVNAALEEWNVPGLSIAVVDGENTYSKGFGFATLPDTPATPETLWYAGSTTKTQTGALLAHLIDTKAHPALAKGWDTTISSILHDDFILKDEWATRNLTLEDALCHRTGMGRHDLAIGDMRNGKEVSLRDQVRNARNLAFNYTPRTTFNYNNFAWFALSLVMETVTGRLLADSLKENIWTPLDMKSTYLSTKDAVNAPEHLSTGYCWDDKTEEFKVIETHVRSLGGAGAIISTVTDMAKFLRCLLHETQPFSEAAHRDLKKPRIIHNTNPSMGQDITTYGVGVERTTYKGRVMFKHSGATDAHGTETFWLPELKFGVVAMGNATQTANMLARILAFKIIDDRLGLEGEDRADWHGMFKAYRAQQREWQGVSKAIEGLFPKRADPPLPPSVEVGKLVGRYFDEGYGELNLRVEEEKEEEEENEDKDEKKEKKCSVKSLVADRTDPWIKQRFRFEHVSGDHWVMHINLLGNPSGINMAVPAEFKVGADGEVGVVEVNFTNEVLGADDGLVVFRRG